MPLWIIGRSAIYFSVSFKIFSQLLAPHDLKLLHCSADKNYFTTLINAGQRRKRTENKTSDFLTEMFLTQFSNDTWENTLNEYFRKIRLNLNQGDKNELDCILIYLTSFMKVSFLFLIFPLFLNEVPPFQKYISYPHHTDLMKLILFGIFLATINYALLIYLDALAIIAGDFNAHIGKSNALFASSF